MNTNKKNTVVPSELNNDNFEVFNFDELNDVIGGTTASEEENKKNQGKALGFGCCNTKEKEEEEEKGVEG